MYYKGALVGRIANRAKRTVVRLPGVRALHGFSYLQALETHSVHLPRLDPRHLPTLETLRTVGALCVPAETLAIPESGSVFAALAHLVEELRAVDARTDNAPRVSFSRLVAFPEIFLWGMDVQLLDLIENYLQLPVRYHGVSVRREVADGRATDVRQWHMDPEDRRMCRIIIYLNDVEPGGGPFQFIERARTIEAMERLRYHTGFVSDRRMEEHVPRSEWREVTAKKGHVVIADTCRVFHRAQAPQIRDRYSATFSYTSTRPIKSYPRDILPPHMHDYLRERANARQLASLA
jgi:hypothetical protein